MKAALPSVDLWTLDPGLEAVPAGNPVAIRLINAPILADVFGGSSVDATKWTVHGGGNVVEGSGHLAVTGASSWDANGIFGLAGVSTAIAATFLFTIVFNTGSNAYVGFKKTFNHLDQGLLVGLYSGDRHMYPYLDGTAIAALTAYNFTIGKTYNIRMVKDAFCNYLVYVSSPDDSAFATELCLYSGKGSAAVATLYPMIETYAGTPYFTNANLAALNYSSGSPVAESPWIAIPGNSISNVAPCIRLVENAVASLMSLSAGSIQYDYALNNGAYQGSWITQAALVTALHKQAISNHTNSLRIKAQFVSDGTQAGDIVVASSLDVTDPTGGGGLRVILGS